MIAGIYREDGPIARLRGKRALLRAGTYDGWCVAQFDDLEMPGSLGWASFPLSDFVPVHRPELDVEDGTPTATYPDVENLGAPECFGVENSTGTLIHHGNVTEQHGVSIAFEGKVGGDQ